MCIANLASRMVIIGVTHDAIHGNVLPQMPNVQHIITQFFDATLSFDPKQWHDEHVIYHHPHTKTDIDPDENLQQQIPVWRLTGRTPWKKEHSFPLTSHGFIGLLMPNLNGFLQRIPTLFSSFAVARADGAFTLACLFYLHWLPLLFNPNRRGVLAVLLTSSLGSLIIVLAFHVNHLQEATEAKPFHPGVDWGAHQVHTTANFESWTFSGGLDIQIEHHLFPMLSYDNAKAVVPVVQQACQEFGIGYLKFDSWFAGLFSHLGHMMNLALEPSGSMTAEL